MSFRILAKSVAASAVLALATTASAAELIVDDLSSPYNAGTDWGMLDAYNTGIAQITYTAPRSGNASRELWGDMTRVQTGYQLTSARTNMGLASTYTGLTFDWRVASDSTNKDYTPSLRMLIHDGSQLSVLVWSGRNNGAANNPLDTWYSTGVDDLFWQWTYKGGDTLNGGEYVLNTLSGWIASLNSTAYVTAISVGAGHSAGKGYHAFVDNVQVHRGAQSTGYNFELAQAVPEPASWMMLLLGFAGVGGMLRGKRRNAGRVRYRTHGHPASR